MLDSLHTWKLEIGGTDRTALVRPNTLTWTTREGRELDSLSVVLDDRAGVFGSSIAAYVTVVLTVDPGEASEEVVFGGYVTAPKPEPDATGQWLSWEVQASGWEVLWDATPRVYRTWLNTAAGTIFIELLTAAGLNTEFDVSTYVETGPTIEVFTAAGEKTTQLCDALAKLAAMAWWCDPDKNAHLAEEDSASQATPFDVIQPGTLANHALDLYEIEAGTLRVRPDATGIVNRLRIVGGWAIDTPVTDTFAGSDAETVSIGLAFGLSHQNIKTNVTVSLNGTFQVLGTAFLNYFGQVRSDGSVIQVLVSRINGVVYFPPATVFDPADVIEVSYQVASRQELTLDASNSASSAASLALFGRYFDGDLDVSPITDEAAMILIGEAYLAQYAFAVQIGEFATQRLGLKAGQNCGITSARDGLSGRYVLRAVHNELLETGYVRSTAKFGGRTERLSSWVGGGGGGGTGSGGWTGSNEPIQGDAGPLNLIDVLTALKPGTVWDPSTGGDATGLVLAPATVSAAGRLLGYLNGGLQAYFDSDGTFKGGRGAVVISEYGIGIDGVAGRYDGRTITWTDDPTIDPTDQTRYLEIGPQVDLGVVTQANFVSNTNVNIATGPSHDVTISASEDSGSGGTINLLAAALIYANDVRITNVADASADTDALNRQTGDARYAPIASAHAAVTLAADAQTILNLSTQEIGLVAQPANRVFAGPVSGADADPTMRALAAADLPAATTSAQGAVELATVVEAATGTDTASAVTPAGLPLRVVGAGWALKETDGDAPGGNSRGSGAVDLQSTRGVASQVASGVRSTIGGGYSNKASATHATVAGGASNMATAESATVGGGSSNAAIEAFATVPGGADNVAAGTSATVGGGYDNIAEANYATVVGGRQAHARLYGQQAAAAGQFAARGDAQRSDFVLRGATSDGTQTELFLDGATERLTIQDDTTWFFELRIAARRTDANGESAAYILQGCIDRNAGTVALVGSVTKTVLAEDTAAWDVSATADDTNKALAVKVTGEAGKAIRWVGHVGTVEVTG